VYYLTNTLCMLVCMHMYNATRRSISSIILRVVAIGSRHWKL